MGYFYFGDLFKVVIKVVEEALVVGQNKGFLIRGKARKAVGVVYVVDNVSVFPIQNLKLFLLLATKKFALAY